MKRMIAVILAVLTLTGCQLASEEQREDQLQDKLVGVLITFDSLELEFDMEAYLNDNLGALKGEEITLDSAEAMKYSDRLWAEVTEEGWQFPGIEGIVMGQMWKDDHWVSFSDEGFCDLSIHHNSGDGLEAITEEGAVYFPAGSEVMLCSNPVYRTEDGRYYAVRGEFFHSRLEEGGAMSQSIKDEKTWTVDGVETTYSAEFTTAVKGVTIAESLRLVWMSENHQELSRAEYVPGELPESLEAEGAYLILEEISGETVNRRLCQPGDEYVSVYYKGEQPWCVPEVVQINWPE